MNKIWFYVLHRFGANNWIVGISDDIRPLYLFVKKDGTLSDYYSPHHNYSGFKTRREAISIIKKYWKVARATPKPLPLILSGMTVEWFLLKDKHEKIMRSN